MKLSQLIKSLFLPRRAIWRNTDYDLEVVIVAKMGVMGGVRYFQREGSKTGIPENQLIFK